MKTKTVLFIILLLVGVYFICNNKNSKMTNSDIVVYGTKKCPYTVKMLNELETHHVAHVFVDTHTSVGNDKFMKMLYGFNFESMPGVPFVINEKTNRYVIGFVKHDQLVQKNIL